MYQSLYRKYRPKSFLDVCGQKTIIKILKNSIINNKISHAYMFSGPRGTGKTSTAKIFAKVINCLDNSSGESCGKCKNCEEINSGLAVDIIEIDAASNNGVDEIRELRNNVKLSCASLKYKVYIIDEVHMLSTGAFNALLKTLEEPPEHVIFILATTDPQKVPSTIISRCQCYSFGQISVNEIVSNLKMISEKEKISIDDVILEKIALASNGGMRDSIGLLEKVSLYGNNITEAEFDELCGFVTNSDIDNFIESMLHGDVKKIVNLIDNYYLSGINLVTFLSQTMEKTRVLLEKNLDTNTRKYVRIIKILNEVIYAIKSATNPRSVAIAMLLDSFNNLIENNKIDNSSTNDIKDDSNICINKEKKVSHDIVEKEKNNNAKNKIINKSNKVSNIVISNDIIINNTFATASKENLKKTKELWKKLNEFILDSKYGSNVSFLLDSNICAVGEKNMILSFNYSSLVTRARDMYETLNDTISNLLNINYYIAYLSQDEWEAEKNKFIQNKKDGNVYSYIDTNPISFINNENDDNESIKNNKNIEEANLIFGDSIVEYE